MKNSGQGTSIVPISDNLGSSISSFHPTLENFLIDVGLPTENILSPIAARKTIIDSLKDVLDSLPYEERQKSYYLTKFTVAVTVGLFDGALNYLWDETVAALRRLVSHFDIQYFFSVAEQLNSRNKSLNTVEDLDRIADHDLLESCRRIGLITDVHYKRLEYVNFMRNHASAAHPNENEIDGFDLLSWLTTCLKYAINAEPDHSVMSVKKLLESIRTVLIPADDIPAIGTDIEKQPQERIDGLLWTFFGIYVDPRQTSTTKTNIASLAPYIWNASSEDKKYEIGVRYGVFRKSADITKKDSTDDFLQIVNGQNYKDEDSLAGELIEKLGTLKSVHFGVNNFYNEYSHAKALGESLPKNGKVPRAARPTWVKVIGICYIGNGLGYRKGVDESALPHYEKYIKNFGEAEVIDFLRLMSDPEFTTSMTAAKADNRTRRLANKLKTKSANVHIQRALKSIIDGPKCKLDNIQEEFSYKDAMKFIPNAN